MNKERISKKMKDFYPLNKEGFTPPINWQDWDFIITSLETLEEVRDACTERLSSNQSFIFIPRILDILDNKEEK